MVRILVADDHTMFREGLREMLERQSDFDVVGEAADGLETVRMARELCPDIVLMDIHMPLLDGIAASRRISDVCLKSRVIILTMDHEDDTVFEAIRAGAQGYVLKEARTRDLVETVRAVHRGERASAVPWRPRYWWSSAVWPNRPPLQCRPWRSRRERRPCWG